MTRLFCVWLMAACVLCSLRSQAVEPILENNELVVLIGELDTITKITDPCMGHPECIFIDNAYQARYHIDEVRYGIYAERDISFEIYGYDTLPYFAKSKHALVFVRLNRGLGFNHLLAYQGFDVYRGKEGDWYVCGDPYPQDTPASQKKLIERPFSISGEDSALVVNSYVDSSHFEIDKDIAHCLHGVTADEMVHIVDKRLLKPAGMTMFPDEEKSSSCTPRTLELSEPTKDGNCVQPL